MRDVAKGFQVDERLIPWGTTLEETARLLGYDPSEACSHEVTVPCRLACGLPALSARPSGPATNRPVLSVAYDLADVRGPFADDCVAAISDRFGPPDNVDRDELSEGVRPEDGVILHANWSSGDFGIGLSIFGGPREVDHGRSIGTLWISWREEPAAAPYLAEWRERSARLAASASALTDIRVYALAWPGHPAYGVSERRPETNALRQSRYLRLCLHAPELLATPDAIADRLNDSCFAIWFNQSEEIWCASTLWETLANRYGDAVSIDWIELLPAKGGGHSALEIGPWRVMSSQGSPEIADAMRHLEVFSGVRIVRHDGYDC